MATTADTDIAAADDDAAPTVARACPAWLALWPAFLAACALEALVFSLVDPQDLRLLDGGPLTLSRLGVYTLGFFVFWAVALGSGWLTLVLARPGGGRLSDKARR